mmetsp:Transcript_60778/g.83446  ORF Transcript_60778/g.83446 Transcript_60778/m.83446 type:complete len:200 (+) Transcript_60778:176-775(+)
MPEIPQKVLLLYELFYYILDAHGCSSRTGGPQLTFAINILDNCHRSSISSPSFLQLEHTRVTTVAVQISWTKVVQKLKKMRALPDPRVCELELVLGVGRLTPCMLYIPCRMFEGSLLLSPPPSLRKPDDFVSERFQFFGFWLSGDNSFVLDERAQHVPEHGKAVFRGTPKLSKSDALPHYYQLPIICRHVRKSGVLPSR